MRYPYIKPTRKKHDSGYRCFEVGYCEVDEDGKAINIEIIGRGTDHIWTSARAILNKQQFDWNMDLLNNGYIRIFSHTNELEWDSDFGLSSMSWRPKGLLNE